VEKQRLKDQVVSSPMVRVGCDQRTLWDSIAPGVQGLSMSIAWLNIEVNNSDSNQPYPWYNNPSLEAPHQRIQTYTSWSS